MDRGSRVAKRKGVPSWLPADCMLTDGASGNRLARRLAVMSIRGSPSP
ncbi:hypothetical protein P355_4413 [Burkholderia cenocepacia KC-01]|nr:hypothetical protein P355_4413 [Burkholderia cenocepacia KC-01]